MRLMCCLGSKAIKTLFGDLIDVITSTTSCLSSEEIEIFINNFKNVLKEKISEIRILTDEINYLISNYLAFKANFSNKKDNNANIYSLEEDYEQKIFEIEILQMKIKNKDLENELIKQFMIENEK